MSPATLQQDINGTHSESSRAATGDDGNDDLASLSNRLRGIQQEIDTTENQITGDEDEYNTALNELESEREKLKAQLKERDSASGDLKKQVNKAEVASRAAHAEMKRKKDLLQRHESQRKKRREEITKWEEDISFMTKKQASVELDTTAVEEKTQSDIRQIRGKIEEEQEEVRALDEENREKASEIKALEEERQQMNMDEETDESREADRLDRERDEHFQRTMYDMQNTYRHLHGLVQQAQREYDLARDRLSYCESQRRATAALPAPIDMDAVRRATRPARKPRHNHSLTSSVSSPRGASSYDTYGTPGGFSVVNASPTMAGPTFFNAKNGMTLIAPPESPEDEKEKLDLTGGAPMSPNASALIPADLLGDESADDIAEDSEGPTRPTGVERVKFPFPQLGPPSIRGGEQENVPGSPSPISSSSKSFSSHRESFTNTQIHDSDGTSLRSGRESFQQEREGDAAQSNSKRLMSSLFSFNRQRGKTSTDEPPMLGSLKAGQSQSFPRNFGDDFDPKTRRRLSYGANWAFNPGNLLPRSSTDKEPSAARRALPGLFSSLNRAGATPSYDAFAARGSPVADPSIRIDSSSTRPSSLYSFDKMPRPSMESQFHAWGAEKSGLRGSPLGPDWASTHSGWSRNPSRRPSIHHGSTSNLSLSVPADSDYLEPDEPQRIVQAPIGTRPTSSQRPLTPKLNPAAPSFTTLFNRNKDRSKVKDKLVEIPADDNSPPTSRKSKETPSLVSTAESRESLERTTSTHSAGTPTPQGEVTPAKPTIFSKITRKASSNKFGSWKLSRERTPNSTLGGSTDVEGTDEASGSLEQLGKSLESTSTTPSGEKDRDFGNIDSLREKVEGSSKDKKASRSSLTWSFMRTKKKLGKDDLTASEVSESSEKASEVSEGEEDE